MLKLQISFASQKSHKIITGLAPLIKSFLRVKFEYFFFPTVLSDSKTCVPILIGVFVSALGYLILC